MVRHVILRVWIADRPGSLGALASTVGALGADLTGIDILDRAEGRAADELTVELPEGVSTERLVDAVAGVAGVQVEDVRLIASRVRPAERDPLEAAVALASASTAEELLEALVRGTAAAFDADWSVVLDAGVAPPALLAAAGRPPAGEWLAGFVEGRAASSPAAGPGHIGPRELAWAALPPGELVCVVGRDGRPFLARERRQFGSLCRIAGAVRGLLTMGERAAAP